MPVFARLVCALGPGRLFVCFSLAALGCEGEAGTSVFQCSLGGLGSCMTSLSCDPFTSSCLIVACR